MINPSTARIDDATIARLCDGDAEMAANIRTALIKYDLKHINVDLSVFPESYLQEIRKIYIHNRVQSERVKVLKADVGKRNRSFITRHYAFMGNPGTGKSTAAKLLGFILREFKLLPKGEFFEASRPDLVGDVVGQTERKTRKILNRAKGSILFINEAYQLVPSNSPMDFGPFAMQEIMRFMEEYREEIIVIVDGYRKEMESFFNENPGIRDRFSRKIIFEDLADGALFDVAKVLLEEYHYRFDDEVLARKEMDVILNKVRSEYKEKGNVFANGRSLRNLIDVLIEIQEASIYRKPNKTQDDFKLIRAESISKALAIVEEIWGLRG